MGVFVERPKCVGCGKCAAICPGHVIRMDETGKAYLKEPENCWSCVSCMKECGRQAIFMVLPVEFGGRGGRLFTEKKGNITKWRMEKADGQTVVLLTDTKEANQY